ncbi:4-hydroxybenzoate polyprenyltransferase [Tamaricihabitans halophyticus]|uniref:4-hydroxybenzoate polyprenyltransferase n=1 Tax=Tamaricihabitans halophyticus TaxID=1262583 RepID=A0A4R2R2X6_9PSEU|nr:4-hydroxybenzoate polyprenyltransferase [Tamaricihabitans halophyticus]
MVLHRLQYPLPIMYGCAAVWGAGFAAYHVEQVVTFAVLLACLGNIAGMLSGLALNVVLDVDTDRRHQEKSYLADAVERVGNRRAAAWIVGMAAGSVVAAFGAAADTGSWWLCLAAVGTLLLHIAYNVDPVRLKRRGLYGPLVFAVAMVGGPFLLSYGAVGTELTPAAIPFVLALIALNMGRTVWWSVPDHEADIRDAMATPVARHGPGRALGIACTILFAGVVLLFWALWWRFGVVLAVLGSTAEALLLIGMIRSTRRVMAGQSLRAEHQRLRTMPLVAAGSVFLAALPLLAMTGA